MTFEPPKPFHIFYNLRELIDYIPTCIICSKPLYMKIYASKDNFSSRFNELFHPSKVKTSKLYVKDNILKLSNKETKLAINIDNNQVIEGIDYFHKIMTGLISIKKTCKTCDFVIRTEYSCDLKTGYIKTSNIFPELKLSHEWLRFRNKNGYLTSINKYYYAEYGLSLLEKITKADIGINYEYFTCDYFNFADIRNFSHLKRRIKTILTFG